MKTTLLPLCSINILAPPIQAISSKMQSGDCEISRCGDNDFMMTTLLGRRYPTSVRVSHQYRIVGFPIPFLCWISSGSERTL
ncbi:hypothetical protein BJX76DRAFT_327702 [Aspergillus varians]